MRISALIAFLLLLVMACTQASPTPANEPTEGAAPTPTTPAAVATPTTAPVADPTQEATPTTAQNPSPTPAAGTPTAPPEPTPTVDPATVYSRVLADLASVRGLTPTEDVTPQFMTREELEATLLEDLEESAEDIYHAELFYKILGLIPQNGDLHQLFLDLYTEQVAGFYDSETEELYLISGSQDDGLSALEEITLAHEYVHALQQQHFDIDSMLDEVEDNSDASSALRALVEGDASVAELRYMVAHISRERQIEALYGSRDNDSSAFDSTPYVLQQSLLFPYVQGQDFIAALQVSSPGWKVVNEAFGNPPASTEQVIHPEKYVSGEAPVAVSLPDVADALGEDWEAIYSDVMGEFFLRTYLETRTTALTAAEAAAGWGGDMFTILRGPGEEYALVSLLEWDTRRDAREFLKAVESSGGVSEEDFLGLNGSRMLWVLSPSEEVTQQIRSLWPEF